MNQQSTDYVVMVHPDHFGFNPQTAETNPFQHTPQSLHKDGNYVRNAAIAEFEGMVAKIRKHGITVLVLPSKSDVLTPDAIFPNNWFSQHQDGTVVLYPMLTPNRRLERQKEALVHLLKDAGIPTSEVIDLSKDEEKGLVLEGTGSMIFDRVNKMAFAMDSARTIREEFQKWCTIMHYEGMFISSTTKHTKDVYHTNMNMCIGSEFVVICLDVIEDIEERAHVRKKFIDLGKDVIEISLEQVHQFCGNILELQTKDGKRIIIMSETARNGFTKNQLYSLDHYGTIVTFSIPTIEQVGAGGVRCMVAEIFRQEN